MVWVSQQKKQLEIFLKNKRIWNEILEGEEGIIIFYLGGRRGEKEPHDSISEIHPFFQVSSFTGNSQEINFLKIPLQALFQLDKTNTSHQLWVHTGREKKNKRLIYTRNPTHLTTEVPPDPSRPGVCEQTHLPAAIVSHCRCHRMAGPTWSHHPPAEVQPVPTSGQRDVVGKTWTLSLRWTTSLEHAHGLSWWEATWEILPAPPHVEELSRSRSGKV